MSDVDCEACHESEKNLPLAILVDGVHHTIPGYIKIHVE